MSLYAGFKAQPFYKIKDPLPGSGFLGQWDHIVCLNPKAVIWELVLSSFACAVFRLFRIGLYTLLVPVTFRKQFLNLQEHGSILFLRQTLRLQRATFSLFGFMFLFQRETNDPSIQALLLLRPRASSLPLCPIPSQGRVWSINGYRLSALVLLTY